MTMAARKRPPSDAPEPAPRKRPSQGHKIAELESMIARQTEAIEALQTQIASGTLKPIPMGSLVVRVPVWVLDAIDRIGPNRSEAARAVLERGLDGWTPSPEGEPRKPSVRYRLKS